MIANLKNIKAKFVTLKKQGLDPNSHLAQCLINYGKAITTIAESTLQTNTDEEDPLYVREGYESASQMEWFNCEEVLDYCREIEKTIAQVTKVSPPKKAPRQKPPTDQPTFDLGISQDCKYFTASMYRS